MSATPEHVIAKWEARAERLEEGQRHAHKVNHCYPIKKPYEDCWRCSRERAVCKSKQRYSTLEESLKVCDRVNHPSRTALLIPYICKWGAGLHFHNRTAKTSSEIRRARKRLSRRLRTVSS